MGAGWLFAFSAVVAITLDKDGLSVVEKTVQQGGGHGGVTSEDTGPVFEGDVGSDDDGAMLVAFGDNLEQELGTSLVEGGVSQVIKKQQPRVLETLIFRVQCR